MELSIIVIILGILVILTPAALIYYYAIRKSNKRKSIQKEFLQKYDGKEYSIVRFCSQERFKKIWKIFPWEATGVLFVENSKIICKMCSMKGEEISFEFCCKDISLDWIGNKNWLKNGTTSWFLIQDSQKKYYFTSETGPSILKSKESTFDILAKIKEGVVN